MSYIFLGSVDTPSLLMTWPNYST
uniref:Uncharacterized protein n=1 Tax=Arundo donax TaxID=35708 RepID=A0A0A8Y377_ARUDO